ncbi:unnamed protein product [Alternaria alternata]
MVSQEILRSKNSLCDRDRMYIWDYFIKNDKPLEDKFVLIASNPEIEKDWNSKKKELAELGFKKIKTSFYKFVG